MGLPAHVPAIQRWLIEALHVPEIDRLRFVLHGGRGRLLRVAEVAEQLGVCAATVDGLCERGELLHLRVVSSIRIRPSDLAEFVSR